MSLNRLKELLAHRVNHYAIDFDRTGYPIVYVRPDDISRVRTMIFKELPGAYFNVKALTWWRRLWFSVARRFQ